MLAIACFCLTITAVSSKLFNDSAYKPHLKLPNSNRVGRLSKGSTGKFTANHFLYTSYNVGFIAIGAVMMMVQHPWTVIRDNRICHFNASMNSLQTYWLPWNNYPIYLMHEKHWEVR